VRGQPARHPACGAGPPWFTGSYRRPGRRCLVPGSTYGEPVPSSIRSGRRKRRRDTMMTTRSEHARTGTRRNRRQTSLVLAAVAFALVTALISGCQPNTGSGGGGQTPGPSTSKSGTAPGGSGAAF
jgi:hypothetical protein